MQKLKIAILGYGHIGKKHAEITAQMEGCELIALIDPKFATESVAGLPGVAPFYSLEDFLQSGLAGSVKVGGPYMNKVEKCIIKDYIQPELAETSNANDYGNFKGSAQNHHHLYQDVIDFFKQGKQIQTTTDDCVKVLKMIANIYASNYSI